MQIENYDSNILKDADHIISFINEVTRKQEAKKFEKPIMNWIHTFSKFEDVIQVLRAELKIKDNISIKIAEQNIKSMLIYNMQNITSFKGGKIIGFYLGFADIRKKLKQYRKEYVSSNLSYKIHLTT